MAGTSASVRSRPAFGASPVLRSSVFCSSTKLTLGPKGCSHRSTNHSVPVFPTLGSFDQQQYQKPAPIRNNVYCQIYLYHIFFVTMKDHFLPDHPSSSKIIFFRPPKNPPPPLIIENNVIQNSPSSPQCITLLINSKMARFNLLVEKNIN